MKVRAEGFILITVLIFLQIFSLMGLYGLMTVSMTMRINRDLWQKEKYLLLAKQILRQVEHHLAHQDSACMMLPISASMLTKKTLSWWRQFSCSGNLAGNEYHYVVEFLGKDTCSVIQKNDNNHRVIATYYRITLLFLAKKAKNRKVFFQSTVTKATDEVSSCEPYHAVSVGRQMWREIK